MKTVRLGCTDIGAILFAGIDDDNNLCSTYILLQLVNYTNCEKLWQIAFINNGQLGIFNG